MEEEIKEEERPQKAQARERKEVSRTKSPENTEMYNILRNKRWIKKHRFPRPRLQDERCSVVVV